MTAPAAEVEPLAPHLPAHRDPYYAGKWQRPKSGRYVDTINPGTGEPLGKVADGSDADAEAAIAAAKAAFRDWRRTPPLERAKLLRKIAEVLRLNGDELAMMTPPIAAIPIRRWSGMRRRAPRNSSSMPVSSPR